MAATKLAVMIGRQHSLTLSDCKVTFPYVPISTFICETRNGRKPRHLSINKDPQGGILDFLVT